MRQTYAEKSAYPEVQVIFFATCLLDTYRESHWEWSTAGTGYFNEQQDI